MVTKMNEEKAHLSTFSSDTKPSTWNTLEHSGSSHENPSQTSQKDSLMEPEYTQSGKTNSFSCEKPADLPERNSDHDVLKDTSKLLPSEISKDCSDSVSGSLKYSHPCRSNISSSQLHLNVRVLYGLVTCLAAIFVCSGFICILHIRSLRRDLDLMNDALYRVKKSQLSVEQISHLTEFIQRFEFGDQSDAQTDKTRFWEAVLGEVDKPAREDPETASDTESVMEKREKRATQDGFPEDWAWMNSFVRVPISVLKSYCQQAKTYCNAQGPRGAPGERGPKGEKGNSGNGVGYNGRPLRGPAGPKGDRGEPGPRGPEGRMGATGRHGQDGSPGPIGEKGDKGDKGDPGRTGTPGALAQKGEPGQRGPKGRRGLGGNPGMPGHKGLKGDKGSQGYRGYIGPKGDPGYCEVFQCVEVDPPTEAPAKTTTTDTPTLPPIAKVCSVDIIGKPVFMGQRDQQQGAWMLDAAGQGSRNNPGKIWATYGKEGSVVWEFPNKDYFRNNNGGIAHNLSGIPYVGTGHKVHDGYIYYHWKDTAKIVRFDLARNEASTVRVLPGLADTSSSQSKEQAFLYSSKTSFVDFHVDRNGLWAVYVRSSTGKVVASYLDMETLDVKVTVVLDDLSPKTRGGAFIVCGKLYTIRHHNRQRSKIDGVYDLWQDGKLTSLQIKFAIPYGQNAMVSYNFRLNQILAWDLARQLSYPLLLK